MRLRISTQSRLILFQNLCRTGKFFFISSNLPIWEAVSLRKWNIFGDTEIRFQPFWRNFMWKTMWIKKSVTSVYCSFFNFDIIFSLTKFEYFTPRSLYFQSLFFCILCALGTQFIWGYTNKKLFCRKRVFAKCSWISALGFNIFTYFF